MDTNINKEIIDACSTYDTMLQAAKSINIPYSTFKRKAISLGVWNTNQGGKNIKRGHTYPLSDYFENKRGVTSYNLKLRLFAEGVKTKQCEECSIEDWCNKKISFELHHVDGDSKNNRLDNLKILCPNCHSQTDNFRFRGRTRI